MWAPRCFQGPLIVLPCLAILGFLQGASSSAFLIGAPLFDSSTSVSRGSTARV